MEIRTAILVDGSFFIKRVNYFRKKFFKSRADFTADDYVSILGGITKRHLSSGHDRNRPTYYLYRTFFYDSAPLDISIHQPVVEAGETQKRIKHFGKVTENLCRNEFLERLKTQRKVALRLGTIKHHKRWSIRQPAVADMLSGVLKSRRFEK